MSLQMDLERARIVALGVGKREIAEVIKGLMAVDAGAHLPKHKKIRVTYTDGHWQLFLSSENWIKNKLREIVDLAGGRISTITIQDFPLKCQSCCNYTKSCCYFNHNTALAEMLGFCTDWEPVLDFEWVANNSESFKAMSAEHQREGENG